MMSARRVRLRGDRHFRDHARRAILRYLGFCSPHLAGVSVERVFRAGRSVRIRVRASGPEAVCPACGTVSRRVHSRYERRLSDLAVSGQEVMIELSARRFFCMATACEKVTFRDAVDAARS
jgi:transposase